MDWERILLTSSPFIGMFFLLTMLVMATCVRKLEEYEDMRNDPILFDFTDFPEIPSLNNIETPITYENNIFKENMDHAFEMATRNTGMATGTPPKSQPIPDVSTLSDDGRFQSEVDGVSFDYEVYNPDAVEYDKSP